MGVFVFPFLNGSVSFLHGDVSMFLGFLYRSNGVCFVGQYCRQCCCFYIITVAVSFIVIIITCISDIIVIIILYTRITFLFYPYFDVIVIVS